MSWCRRASTQNCKAAIFAVDEFFQRTGKTRLPAGHSIKAFFMSVQQAKLFAVGINFALGAGQMKKFYKRLSDINLGWCQVCPNAGLSNAMGGYDEDSEMFGNNLFDYCKNGILPCSFRV